LFGAAVKHRHFWRTQPGFSSHYTTLELRPRQIAGRLSRRAKHAVDTGPRFFAWAFGKPRIFNALQSASQLQFVTSLLKNLG
jgi:hypothetical protein